MRIRSSKCRKGFMIGMSWAVVLPVTVKQCFQFINIFVNYYSYILEIKVSRSIIYVNKIINKLSFNIIEITIDQIN